MKILCSENKDDLNFIQHLSKWETCNLYMCLYMVISCIDSRLCTNHTQITIVIPFGNSFAGRVRRSITSKLFTKVTSWSNDTYMYMYMYICLTVIEVALCCPKVRVLFVYFCFLR